MPTRQLAEWGRERDLELAAELDASNFAPRLIDGGFQAHREQETT